ncbi:MAG: glutamine transporter, periplasmic glutamine-binding protein [Rhodospirillales bacterium]|nr:glutamine transporter, periplasmic glutamine-binding protein [Rhodospirillales bacterium]
MSSMKSWAGALLGVLVAVATVQGASAETTLEKIRRTGVMSSANSFEYAPFGYVEDGKTTGLDVDLANEIGRRMGVKVTFEKIDFKGIIAALISGRVDTLVTALTWAPDRAERILFSVPYFDGGVGAAYRDGEPKIAVLDDVKGKNVGVQLGSAGDHYFREQIGPDKVKSLKSYDTILLALKDLENGRSDVVVSALPAVRYAMRTMPTIRVTDAWDSRPVGINTRKTDQDLMDEINRHVVAMKQEGVLDQLIEKWFGKKPGA